MCDGLELIYDDESGTWSEAPETYGSIAFETQEALEKAVNILNNYKWTSVDEALPENDADCLVWYKCDTAFGKSESWGIAHCSRCDWYTKYLNGDNIVVLYWQPLPEPPEAIKG